MKIIYLFSINLLLIIAVAKGQSTIVYFDYDASGSVTELTDKRGNVVEKYSYDIFGAPTIENGSGDIVQASAYNNRFMFTAREYIKELDLYDYRNRSFSSTLGRFLQIDPIRFNGRDINLYRYVKNNSVNKVDTYGLEDCPTDSKIGCTAWKKIGCFCCRTCVEVNPFGDTKGMAYVNCVF